MANIHPSSVVDPDARIGAEVEIGPFCFVEADTVIGDGCRLLSHAVVRAGTELGAHCTLHANVVLGDGPQDFAFDPATRSRLRIGEHCTFREGFTAHRGTKEDTATVIGNQAYFMANSHVAHNCEVGDHAVFANGVLLAGYVSIGEGAFLSGNSVVHQFCRVGRLAMLSGLGAMSQDLPPFCIAHSTSTNKLSGVNVVGMRRAGMDGEARNAVKEAFRTLYTGGLNTRDALEELGRGEPHEAVREMIEFIEGSARGIGSFHGRKAP